VYDQSQYLNEVNWHETKLKKGYKIEKLFVHQGEGEDKLGAGRRSGYPLKGPNFDLKTYWR
jgi:hypothetical protein